MSIRGKHFTVSSFRCTKCGKEGIPISRKNSRQRERGHLKKLYCIFCQEETNHIEIRDFDHLNELELTDLIENNLENKDE